MLNLARADYANYTLALETVQYLEKEAHYIPWLAALNNLGYVYRRIGNADDQAEYRKWMLKLSELAYSRLGFNATAADAQLDVYQRALLLSTRCKYGNEDCVKAAKQEFSALVLNGTYK